MVKVDGARFSARSLLVALSAAAVAAGACGQVTPAGDEQQVLCATGNCDGGAGVGAARDGGGGARAATDATVSTDKIVPPCTICRRAENCCKARGLGDCGYTAACTNAPSNQQTDYILARCRAVLGASARPGRAPDACVP